VKICGKEISSKYNSLEQEFWKRAEFEEKLSPSGKKYYSLTKESYLILLTLARLVEIDNNSKNNNQA